ncbi:MAG: Rnf-Nqr domain containing protein, partial [Oscillospiraceae bacterium]
MKEMLIILFSAILVENFVLNKFMGICPFLGVSKKMNSALGMSIAVTFVMVM